MLVIKTLKYKFMTIVIMLYWHWVHKYMEIMENYTVTNVFQIFFQIINVLSGNW